jgi:hypothetical protein
MERVIITQCMMGIIGMQVCAVPDATDEEILEVCNMGNPSGTSAGWSTVVHEDTVKKSALLDENCVPRPCDDLPERIHYLVLC